MSFEEGATFAKKNNLLFFETSAKTALNVEKAFLTVTNIILDNINRGEYDLSNEVKQLLFYFSEYRDQTRKCSSIICFERYRFK